jgi:hypothetical protein
MANVCAKLEQEGNANMSDALHQAKQRGAIGVMEFILKKLQTATLAWGVLGWRMRRAAEEALHRVEDAEAKRVACEIVASGDKAAAQKGQKRAAVGHIGQA